MLLFGLVWMVFLVVLAVLVVLRHAPAVRSVRRPRAARRRLWAGLGLDKAALDRVRAAGRSDAGAGTVRPITSEPIRCHAWRHGRHSHACNRLFEEIHRLDRLGYRQETRMKNIGLERQQKEIGS